MKPVRVAISTALIFGLIGAFMVIPIPHHIYCAFYVQPENASKVYVDFPGDLAEIYVKPNQPVKRGMPLVRINSPELEVTIRTMVGQVNVAQVSFDTIRNQAAFDLKAANQKTAYAAALESSYSKLKQREEDIKKLIIKAPVDGWLINPPEFQSSQSDSGSLMTWDGSPLEERNIGAYLEQKTMIGQIVPDLKRLTAVLAIDQSDIEFVQSEQDVELLVRQLPMSTFESKTKTVSPMKMKSIPKALSSFNGGDLVATKDSDGVDVPQSTTYQVSVPLANPDLLISPGSTGVAKIHVGSQTIGRRIWRLACRTFRFEL